MIGFAVGALGLLAVTLFLVLRPLLRDPPARGAAESTVANAGVLRDQLAELERDRANGALGTAAYEQAQLELKRRLLEDTATVEGVRAPVRRWPWGIAAAAGVLAAGAVGLYLVLGTPAALDPQARTAQIGPAQIEAMVARLAQRLEQNPDDLEGWVRLGTSYRVLGRDADAAQAFAKAEPLVEKDPRLLVDYAEALALTHGGNLQGKPSELLRRALVLEPEFPLALMLSGAAAYQREDYAGAARDWEKVYRQFPPDSREAKMVGENIAKAREQAAAARGKTKKP
jgi:cytochrome c-type biogenesis protein CcmH